MERTWETRDLPVLEAITDAYESGEPFTDVAAVAAAAQIDRGAAARSVKALVEDRLIDGTDASSHDGYDLLEPEPTGKGRRVVGQWPAENGYDDLLRLIDERIAQADSAEERNRWEKFRDGVTAVSRPVATTLLTAWIKGQMGL